MRTLFIIMAVFLGASGCASFPYRSADVQPRRLLPSADSSAAEREDFVTQHQAHPNNAGGFTAEGVEHPASEFYTYVNSFEGVSMTPRPVQGAWVALGIGLSVLGSILGASGIAAESSYQNQGFAGFANESDEAAHTRFRVQYTFGILGVTLGVMSIVKGMPESKAASCEAFNQQLQGRVRQIPKRRD